MSQQVVIFNNEFSMSSYEFLTEIINPARVEAGESPVDNRKFLARVRDELGEDGLPAGKVFRLALPQGGYNELTSYDLSGDQLLLVVTCPQS